jgi:hypothetical protein
MGRNKSKSNYFNDETELAIRLYNETEDPTVRARIFSDHIYFPFYKLSENIIHTFKFYYTDTDDIEDLKHKIVTLLLEEKISKFDPTRGTKAYSYFGTIVKRWLINYNNKNYKQLKRRGTLEEYEAESLEPDEIYDQNAISLSEFIDFYVQQMYSELDILFEKENDKKIADAILTIFSTRMDIQLFRKKALYIYIREMTDCKTPHLTQVISKLKERFYELYFHKVDKGLIQTL